MRKILLIMLLIIASASILLAEQIDHEKIMPKKLIYSELPDDYPKELDELFHFYVEILDEIYNISPVKQYRERFEELSKKIKALPEAKINMYAYLLWLARTSIPEYFCEYEVINSPHNTIKTFNNRVSQSFISDELYNKMKNHEELIPGVSSININIKNIIKKNYPEMSNIFQYPNWIKCKVVKSYYVTSDIKNGEAKPENHVLVDIIEDLSENFPKNQVLLQLYMNRFDEKDKTLEEGKIYLIPFKYTCRNDNLVDIQDSTNIDIFSNLFYYSSAVNLCLSITEDNTLKRMIKAPLGKKSLFTFDCDKYDQAKEIIQNSMKLLIRLSNNGR